MDSIFRNLKESLMQTEFVVVLCGPHANGAPQFHRIQAATEIAKSKPHASLVVCGDANRGKDVDQFTGFAKSQGVKTVFGLYSPEMSTISDVQSAVDFIVRRQSTRSTIHLVTDDWHMPRAGTIFRHTLLCSPLAELEPVVRPVAVVGGEPITPEREQLERDGLNAFQNGTYRTGTKLGWGKPDES